MVDKVDNANPPFLRKAGLDEKYITMGDPGVLA